MPRLPRIAVVDGDPKSRDHLVGLLASRGWGVQAFDTLAAATFALVPDPPDLMVVEARLPDGFGLNLLDIVRRRTGEKVTTIAVTAVVDEQEVMRCFAAGAADLVLKPIREQEMIARCRVHLARSADPEPPSPDTPDVPTIEGLAFGRYRILRELGRGGFGIVYLAEDREGRRLVALKVSTPPADDQQAQARFVRETYTLSAIESEHVVRMLDTGVLHGRLYYAMEYVPGPSLARRVSERGALSEAEVRQLARGLLAALAVAHAAGIVHRDVKPSNVILRNGEVERPVLLDFGLAKQTSDRALTKASGEVILGTPAYMAPEIVRGDAEHSPRSDLWSLGMTLRHALEAIDLWPNLTGMNLLHAVATQPLPPLRVNVSTGLTRLLEALCASRPEDRPASATAALEALAAIKDPPSDQHRTPRAPLRDGVSTPRNTSLSFREIRGTPKPPS
jgi:CheY-like chemotaxis protein